MPVRGPRDRHFFLITNDDGRSDGRVNPGSSVGDGATPEFRKAPLEGRGLNRPRDAFPDQLFCERWEAFRGFSF